MTKYVMLRRQTAADTPPHPSHEADVESVDDRIAREARELIAQAVDYYTAGNGRRCSIQDDSGEKCWIVPSDAFEALRSALGKARGDA